MLSCNSRYRHLKRPAVRRISHIVIIVNELTVKPPDSCLHLELRVRGHVTASALFLFGETHKAHRLLFIYISAQLCRVCARG